MKCAAPAHRKPTTPLSVSPSMSRCPTIAVCSATEAPVDARYPACTWTSHSPGRRKAPDRSMTAAFRVSGDRLPPSTSMMRPFSMVTLAPEIDVGLTQSMRVALVRTVRGTREAYRIRRTPAWRGLWGLPDHPSVGTTQDQGEHRVLLDDLRSRGLQIAPSHQQALDTFVVDQLEHGVFVRTHAHGEATPLVLAEEIERRKRVELRGDVPLLPPQEEGRGTRRASAAGQEAELAARVPVLIDEDKGLRLELARAVGVIGRPAKRGEGEDTDHHEPRSPRPAPFPLESLDTSKEIELTRLRHGHLLVSVVPQHPKGEIREVPEQGESAKGREDTHDVGHVLHLVPETVTGHGCLRNGPRRTAFGRWVQTPKRTRPG